MELEQVRSFINTSIHSIVLLVKITTTLQCQYSRRFDLTRVPNGSECKLKSYALVKINLDNEIFSSLDIRDIKGDIPNRTDLIEISRR